MALSSVSAIDSVDRVAIESQRIMKANRAGQTGIVNRMTIILVNFPGGIVSVTQNNLSGVARKPEPEHTGRSRKEAG